MAFNVQMRIVDENGIPKDMDPCTKSANVSIDTDNVNIPQGVETVADLMDELGLLAFADNIDIPTANSTRYGVTKVKSNYTEQGADIDTTSALSIAGASALDNSVVHNTGNENISGVKTFEDGIIISGIRLRPVRNQDGTITLNFEDVDA